MLIILSPSKTIDTNTTSNFKTFSLPHYINESKILVDTIKKLNTSQLSKLMSISPKLAQQTFDRFQFWNKSHVLSNSKQAILSFKGEVYTGLESTSFSEEDLLYSQEHLIIISGLYGILQPLDLLQPYRLEIATKLSIRDYTDLYSFWEVKITKQINRILKATNNSTIINLASNEYFKSINVKKLNANIITPIFKDDKNGTYKIVSIYAKKARGQMSRYIVKNTIDNIDELKLFNEDGYYYNADLSNSANLIFTR